jgi:hypothetical protein
MSTMVLLVLLDLDRLEEVMHGWHAAGAGGITILESRGAGHLLARHALRDDLPLFPGLRRLLESEELHHRTLFTVLPERVDLDAFFDATEAVLGDLDRPNSGFMFAIPVLKVRGENRKNYE